MRRLTLTVATVLTLLMAGVAIPPTTMADVQGAEVYTTPGVHHVNGRQWKTTCEAYSSQVERCRSEIWGQRVLRMSDQWRVEGGWIFNNLTYRPSERRMWAGNPLATPGEHTLNGRR